MLQITRVKLKLCQIVLSICIYSLSYNFSNWFVVVVVVVVVVSCFALFLFIFV